MGSLDSQTDMILILLLATRAAYTTAEQPNILQSLCQSFHFPWCQSDGIQCRHNKDCERNEICSWGKCVEASRPGYCRTKHDCKWNEICSQGRCIPTSDPGYCRSEHHCEVNEICSKGKCILKPGFCRDKYDCKWDEDCIKGKCIDMRCKSSDDCDIPPHGGNGHVMVGTDCVNGHCIPVYIECISSDDCDDGDYCSKEGMCMKNIKPFDPCDHCEPPDVCYDGVCMTRHIDPFGDRE